jgi:hypothetical protein
MEQFGILQIPPENCQAGGMEGLKKRKKEKKGKKKKENPSNSVLSIEFYPREKQPIRGRGRGTAKTLEMQGCVCYGSCL